jgi:peptide-methionine (S)-S-oxide reductase
MSSLKVALTCLGAIALGASFFLTTNRGVAASTSPVNLSKVGTDPGMIKERGPLHPRAGDKLASFSGGCFWGVEEFFRKVPGVVATAVGFTGGHVPNPTYEQVCTHTTGHVETVLVEFDPKVVSYRALVDDFWHVHDPTTVDRQGPDVGNSYRSAIWTYGPDQMKEALASIAARQSKERSKIVTQVKPAETFYLAEDYHQQYDEKTGTNSCPIRE